MAGALSAVEAALDAVERQSRSLARAKHRQVRSGDEIAALKALAYSWFETFKPQLLGPFTAGDLASADRALREVLNATARLSSRAKYAGHLKQAKEALVGLRARAADLGAQAVPSPGNGNEPPPSFTALAPDVRMQEILARRWEEIERCLAGDAALAATVMMGGLLESLFLARINRTSNRKAIFTAKGSPKDKKTGNPLPLSDWSLMHYIEVSHELRWITKSAKEVGGVLREFRNYIHPHKEFTDSVAVTISDAEMFWSLTKSMTKQVLASTALPPL
ncbi:hypothetical protein [Anaeromyxobacter soli]|uniref:hypothetical protein n=1 Tax=Anaeromyxobacter soli TaxID=2922725 RepID=UPI001FB0355D|nr:hypothetical protein [Anaeromyxobacter sp. SG29]